MKLEKANPKDFKKIAQIYKEEFSKKPYYENWTISQSLKKVKQYSKFCDIWKLNYNKELVGFIIVSACTIGLPKEFCFGEELAVKKEYQCKGFGTFILKETFKNYKKKGFKNFIGIANKKGPIKLYKRLNLSPSKKNVLVEKKLK